MQRELHALREEQAALASKASAHDKMTVMSYLACRTTPGYPTRLVLSFSNLELSLPHPCPHRHTTHANTRTLSVFFSHSFYCQKRTYMHTHSFFFSLLSLTLCSNSCIPTCSLLAFWIGSTVRAAQCRLRPTSPFTWCQPHDHGTSTTMTKLQRANYCRTRLTNFILSLFFCLTIAAHPL